MGLSSTSESPADTENITVPATNHKYAESGNNAAPRAYIINPTDVATGIIRTALATLKCFEKNVKTRSVES